MAGRPRRAKRITSTDRPLDIAAWSTEWGIVSAGNPVVAFEAGLFTHDCDRPDLGDSHVAWLQRPRLFSPEHPRPCRHEFRYVVPSAYGSGTALVGQLPTKRVWEQRALWLPQDLLDRPSPSRLTLVPARSAKSWEAMVRMRDEVEREFSGYHPGIARRLVRQIRHRRSRLVGDWYLAFMNGRVVGGMGLVVFETGSGHIGRLQDVDIAPAFRGRGLGSELLWGACERARKLGLDAVCLRADADDWPKDWYLRFGFSPVGRWTCFKV